jgi:hypothetical protein
MYPYFNILRGMAGFARYYLRSIFLTKARAMVVG